jgi:dienelactone hydrolase
MAEDPPAEADAIVMSDCLVLPPVGTYGRSPIHTDPVEAQIIAGAWTPPQSGDAVTAPDGRIANWQAAAAGEDGWLQHDAFGGGYAYWSVESPSDRVMLLEASGHSVVYANGAPRAGDPYAYGFMRLPVALTAGRNDFLFFVQRGRLRAKLTAPPAPVFLDMGDNTMPDLVAGAKGTTYASVVVTNASDAWIDRVQLRIKCEGLTNEYGENLIGMPLPRLAPMTCRKVAITLKDRLTRRDDTVSLELYFGVDNRGLLDEAVHRLEFRVRKPDQPRKITFVSDIDNSVQYYALRPGAASADSAERPALFLSLHGASVEGMRQAEGYQAKVWGHVVAPTNRRPFGFDWEDWGRLDAIEVLDLAAQDLGTDPRRTYLTGHSMGGHGTWQLAAHFPDRFAAIAPSAGWISFASYTGGAKIEGESQVAGLLRRAGNASDTLLLSRNYLHHGVYILHGDADDNVPVTQARTMRRHLADYHADFTYYERPGAGHWWGDECMDWPPIFEMFQRRSIPATADVRRIEFATINPAVSSSCHWASVEAQQQPMLPSTIELTLDDKTGTLTAVTGNVARLRIDRRAFRVPTPPAEGAADRPAAFTWGPALTVQIDGQTLTYTPTESRPPAFIWLVRESGQWAITEFSPAPEHKGPHRAGPFKDAFRHQMIFVYGTKGTDEENAWAAAKVRYDAETWWYRGNGSVDIVRDVDFDPAAAPHRSVILYGHADMIACWDALLGKSPVQVRRGSVSIARRELKGDDLASLFLRPRPGSDVACVAVIGGTGPAGLRLTDRLPYFVSGVAYPDCTVIGADMLTRGEAGIRAAGFFGNDWAVESGEFAFGE